MKRGLAAALLLAAPLGARTWRVAPRGADFPMIAPAVAAAAPGDTIRVSPGIYREDLSIAKTVAIRGEGMPVLMGTGAGTVIDVAAPGCEIRGLAIEESGTGLGGSMDAGIHLGSDRNVVAGNRLRRVFYGVVSEGADNRIEGNSIEGFSAEPFGRRGDGVYFYRSPRGLVADNAIRGMRDAIYLQYAPAALVCRNTVSDSRYGLHDMFTDGAQFVDNVFTGCSVGANVMNCRKVEIRGNRFLRNRGVASAGLSFKECDDSRVEENEFSDDARAVQIEGSSRNRFAENRFAFNDTAVQLFASAEENVFTGNVFDGNLTPVVISGGSSSTRWSEKGRGNWWSGYRGIDFDGRGTGREPQPVASAFSRIEGNNPAARLFLASPAAAALDFAASSVDPGEDGSVDRAPLVRRPKEGRGRRRLAGSGVVAVAFAGVLAARRRSGR
ncbi:MAG TPA: nitrous oxide reductase family maturation protein NosD [Thermoanaerobaculia bacterium]|nr:nitrous oxide reductase family maturation protein NosD [Thermoanaerobaculia bacterium]